MLSPNAKQRAISCLKNKKKILPRGTSKRIRRKFGISISKQNLSKKRHKHYFKIKVKLMP